MSITIFTTVMSGIVTTIGGTFAFDNASSCRSYQEEMVAYYEARGAYVVQEAGFVEQEDQSVWRVVMDDHANDEEIFLDCRIHNTIYK